MLRCINPSSLCGERGDAPEYESNNPFWCAECREEFDRDNDTIHTINEREYCDDCAPDAQAIADAQDRADDEGHPKSCGLWLGEACNCFQSRPDPNDSNR